MENEVFVVDNKITVSTDKLIEEAIKYLRSQTGVTIETYSINGNMVDLTLNGNKENIVVLKDRLGVVEENQNALTDNKVNQLKAAFDKVIRENFDEVYTLTLKSLDITPDIAFLNLTLQLASIPYPATITYKIYEDGLINVGYILYGDVSKDERWSATVLPPQEIVAKLKEIKEYYNMKSALPENK